jgi:hypothetical protein
MMLNIQGWLEGKKTYIVGALYAIDKFGAYVGWWDADQFRTALEMVFALFALRAGVTK